MVVTTAAAATTARITNRAFPFTIPSPRLSTRGAGNPGASLGRCRQFTWRTAVARLEQREKEIVGIGDERPLEVRRDRNRSPAVGDDGQSRALDGGHERVDILHPDL